LEGVITGGGSAYIVGMLAAMQYIHQNLMDIETLRQIDIMIRASDSIGGMVGAGFGLGGGANTSSSPSAPVMAFVIGISRDLADADGMEDSLPIPPQRQEVHIGPNLGLTAWDRYFLPRSHHATIMELKEIWHNPNSTQAQRDEAARLAREIRAPYLRYGEIQLDTGHVLQTTTQILTSMHSPFHPTTTIVFERLFTETGTYIRLTDVSGSIHLDAGFSVEIRGIFAQGGFTGASYIRYFTTNESSFSFDIDPPFIADVGMSISTNVGSSIDFFVTGRNNVPHEVYIVNHVYQTFYIIGGFGGDIFEGFDLQNALQEILGRGGR